MKKNPKLIICFILSFLTMGVIARGNTRDNPGNSYGNRTSNGIPDCTFGLAAIDSGNVLCFGDSTGIAVAEPSGGAAPYTYLWSNSKTTQKITGLTAGTYSIIVTDKNGCTATAPIIITGPKSALVVTLHPMSITCPGTKGTIFSTVKGGTAPYSYSWSNGSTTIGITGLSAGVYSLKVTDKNGCIVQDTATITQPSAVLSDSVTWTARLLCHGDSDGSAEVFPSGGTTPYTYRWSTGSTSSSISGVSAGVYAVSLVDSCGTTVTTSFVITQPSMKLGDRHDSTAAVSGCNGAVKLIVKGGTPPYTYSWSPGGQTTDSVGNECAGTYCCSVVDSDGCTLNTCITVKLITGLSELPDETGISIYPDPGSGLYTVTGIRKGMLVDIYDYTGRKISGFEASDITMQLNITNQADGVYLIRILNKDGILVSQRKVMKLN